MIAVCIAACAASLVLASPSSSSSSSIDSYSWVRGVNYVPSTAHNDVATWQDYDPILIEAELSFAAASGFNAVRTFLSSLVWRYNASAFNVRLAHFISALEERNMTSQLVLFDSCFGAVNANLTWISDGIYKDFTWIPNPGPDMVSDDFSWPLLGAYLADVVAIVGSSAAVAVWDVHNEPDFRVPQMVSFIDAMASALAALDVSARPRTVGVAFSSEQGNVGGLASISMLSFHNYDGSRDGADLAADIAGQLALGAQLGKPVLLTESMNRPSDGLESVLPAVFGCFGANGSAAGVGVGANGSAAGVGVGFFVWELMLGVDQFNSDWTAPFQGLIYPTWAPNGLGGQWWSGAEASLLSTYFDRGSGAPPPCPAAFPMNNSFAPDTSSLWSWSPPAQWTAWEGWGPVAGTLHYANATGAIATLKSPPGSVIPLTALSLVLKTGPDCGIFSIAINGKTAVQDIDTYAPEVDWGAQILVPMPGGVPLVSWTLDILITGHKNSASTNSYGQIVGAIALT